MVSLAELPTELVMQICTSLCLHCQVPRVVDASPDVVAAASPDHSALSHLSQCSRRLQRIVQPVLFHWYHARGGDDYHKQRKRLASFVFTALRNQHLLEAVQAISLYEPKFPLGNTHAFNVEQSVHDADGWYRRVVERLGGHLLNRYSDRPTLEDFNELAIAAMPKLSQLCLQRQCEWNRPESACWTSWSYPLPALTCLALRGAQKDPEYEETYHLHQTRNLIRQAPNLEVLIAPDCAAGAETIVAANCAGQPWDVPLHRLRKLSLSLKGFMMPQLTAIVASCPLLEDLEYFDDGDLLLGQNTFWPARDLRHVTTTLRRLCYSVGEAGATRHDDDESDSDKDSHNGDIPYDVERLSLFRDWNAPTLGSLSLASFTVLEVLELEQLTLYGPCYPLYEPTDEYGGQDPYASATPEGLFARLPPSIRRLRVGGIFNLEVVSRDMLELAAQASRFPLLESIALEFLEGLYQDQIKLLVDTLHDMAGITVSVSLVAWRSRARGLLPPRPGHAERAPKPLLHQAD